MLYWRIDISECIYIHVDGPREESISQRLHTHLKCEEPDPDYIEDTIEWCYVSRCFSSQVCNNNNLTLVDLQPTEQNKVLKLESSNVLHPLFASLPRIRPLRNFPMPTQSIPRLKHFAPNLGALAVADLLTASDFLAVPTAEAVHHHLRSLALYVNLTLNQVRNIFQTFPNLEQAMLLPSDNTNLTVSHDPTTATILTRPIHLERAHLRQLEVGSLDWALSFPDLLTIHFPALESIKVANLKQFRHFNTFVAHCSRVRSVQIDFYSGAWGDGVTATEPERHHGRRYRTPDQLSEREGPSNRLKHLAKDNAERIPQISMARRPHLVELSLLVSTPPVARGA